ncbi:MAG: hypothetical protein HXY50_11590 [Ignavibacteriaceae bacterium]|nr:hypothetical protein [Ignavibacteriaceae bacterium]
MMNKKYFLIAATLFMFSGCVEQKKEDPVSLTRSSLDSLVKDAISGISKANDSLSQITDLNLPENSLYNFVQVDSFYLDSIKYFSVILQHPKSIYNRFAIYNEEGDCFLIDKSLNGKISLERFIVNGITFLKIIESFIAQDSVRLVRLSLYKKIEETFNLVYRNFSELKTAKDVFNQTIISITLDTIKTRLQVPKNYKLKSNTDYFVFSQNSKIYKAH